MKYLIDESQAAGIRQFIKFYVQSDIHSIKWPNFAYPVTTLYLDSKNLQLCRESLEGHKNRFKLRIRSYTDDQSYPRFVEIKRRANTIIIKSRSKVSHTSISSIVRGSVNGEADGDGEEAKSLRQFILYSQWIKAGPVLRTRYLRQAFVSTVDDRVRITFDRNLSYAITPTADVGLNGQGWHTLLPNKVVLEIKFTSYYPAWLSGLARHFNLQQTSISKYSLSVKQASLICAIKVAES
jgi:hypothetical protein